jgi:hypothetical protein
MKSFLGRVQDKVNYDMQIESPKQVKKGLWVARVVADTGEKGGKSYIIMTR